jgi:VanZ family protein
MPLDYPWRFPTRFHFRLAFWAYALAVLVATLWPRLELNVPGVERPDLIVHFLIFGTFYVLLFASGYLAGASRWRSLLLPWLVAVVCAGIDESLQAIPLIRRTAGWDDFAANAAGITIGLIAATLWTFLAGHRRDEQSPA